MLKLYLGVWHKSNISEINKSICIVTKKWSVNTHDLVTNLSWVSLPLGAPKQLDIVTRKAVGLVSQCYWQ